MWTPRIIISNERKIVGNHQTMCFAEYKIGDLWRGFLPRQKEIKNNLTNDLISLAIYKPDHFQTFSAFNLFERWAAVEVADFNHVPEEMESMVIPGGLYAVFDYKGLNTDSSVFKYILETWLPSSGYVLDDRPHFEVLGERYQNNDPLSEEEIWIPVKSK